MTLQEFRKLVRTEFGADLRYMTPANVREFLDRVQPQVDDLGVHRNGSSNGHSNGTIYLDEPEKTYEGILRDFLRQVLDMPSDQAVIRLWLYSLELTNASVSELEADKFQKLFAALAADGVE